MEPKFIQKLKQTNNRLILHLNPIFALLPLPITRYDDPFLPFSKEIISATSDLVAGYFFDFASYLAMGGAGAVALERSIAFVPDTCVTILHGAFTGIGYSPMSDNFGLDAITVASDDDLMYYTAHLPYMAFVVSDTEDPMPDRGGIYKAHEGHLLYKANNIPDSLSLTTDSLLYSSKLDDFAEKVREGVLSHL